MKPDRKSLAAAILAAGIALAAGGLTPDAAPAARAETVSGTASVIDGDTIEIHGARIRLHAIDAIEKDQRCRRPDGSAWRCGRDAAFALADRIGRAPVTCDIRDIDRYGRLVGICFGNGEDLNAWMVRNGWALAYRRYGTDYVGEEAEASAARRGIWAAEFMAPWDWRRR
ncbi:thermonuclease family protein [Defluviimonas salinarum]|uniref:Thermonuclease family protein n=1 Tax=Defluviimonas salinarum TaxID=2992147 RepID=A0ABT3J894_9RHOB|nr:thermonuclease family protein [Defluviimonas salinarum]MCW3783916.1 thermonuclease family protein [Defluviimonas salinarum]